MAYRFIRTDLALSLVTLAILALSLVPPTIAAILDDLTLFVAVFGAFLLPGTSLTPFSGYQTKSVIMEFSSDTHHRSLLPSPSFDRRAQGAILSLEHATHIRPRTLPISIPRSASSAQRTAPPAQATRQACIVGHYYLDCVVANMYLRAGLGGRPLDATVVADFEVMSIC